MEVRLRRLGSNSKVKILKVPKECSSKMWLAGRGTCCQIYTKSKFASRQHFCITFKEQKYFISDLKSANGTFVNDEKVDCERCLEFGNIISVGVPSEMKNSPDCIVYVFEQHYNGSSAIKEMISAQTNVKDTHPIDQPNLGLENGESMEVDPHADSVHKDSDRSDVVIVSGTVDPEKTVVNDSDIILIESPAQEDPIPAKMRKVKEESPPQTSVWKSVVPKGEDEHATREPAKEDDDDLLAYEALTQVDEPQVKSEPDLLNYSLTEELIEISDSDDDWSPGMKAAGSGTPEVEDEDDDIVVLETIIRSKDQSKFDAPPIALGVEDDLSEVDKKWMGKLLKIKSEEEVFEGAEESIKKRDDEKLLRRGERLTPCKIMLNGVDTVDREQSSSASSAKGIEIPNAIAKRIKEKKSVRFNLVPEIKYFEVPPRPKLTASEKGRFRFARIIFNICNWNTHWLEECKRVAPDKDPPDICEERLRKIPKKFPSHSDYMAAFIPAVLLHLWNRVKHRWVTSGESGFRQTVSCDSFDNYHAENLYVYKCTGLVQNVEVHKELLREGHLVLLRLHQSQNPQFATSASEKYSKKLGYLIFGFIEERLYERYHDQTLHELLAERCASVVGDLHVVRLTILVKKRPNFFIDKSKLAQLTVIQRISQEIRMLRGICFLPDSPLCASILKPTKTAFPLMESPKKQKLIFKGPLDDTQSDLVRRLSFTCSSANSFVHSIHGAAGTGKGQVIVALILQLLHGDEWKGCRPKVVYCTQWSVPLDETVARLKVLSQSADESFSLVRVGPLREIKPEVRDLCLTHLAASFNTDQRLSWRFDSEVEVLKEADVICTTCISAGITKMSAAFEKLRGRKVICIIDEAMSSPEKDSVIPLQLGVTHLILVGDIYQLEPPLSGEKTHSLGLDMPLFWRIYKNFTGLEKELWPISILKTQYRMNSALTKLTPLIYDTPLQKPSATVSGRIPSFRTHLVFVDRPPENSSKTEKESRGLKIVAELVKAVVKMSKVTSRAVNRLAVIICEPKQSELLQSALPKREYGQVEINQVQAFQGREFEVVVLFYDGRKMLTSWLATALTRAKCSLFVFASQQSLGGNSLIRKMADSAEKHNLVKYVRPEMSSEEFEQIILM